VKARSALVVALALALTATSCGQGDPTPERAVPRASSTSTSEATTPPTSSPTRPAPLEWEGCGDGECATLAVPVDHDEPAGPTLELALARLPATGDRIGPLLVNFGGPGSRTVELLGGFPWPDAVRQRFDIVAVDPRGVGSSSPLRCGPPAAEVYDLDHAVDDAAERQALVELSERYAADCAERHGALLPRVGTADVARDLDLVRAALGDEQLSYLGFSYGTSIGQVYADRFPERVRAMVLDGVVDPSLDGLATAAQQAVGFEVALERWAGGCADRPTCPGPDPIAAVDDVLAAVEAGIPAGDRSLGPGEATIGLALALYAESLWPALDQAIADARDGSGGELLALADQYGSLVELPAYYAVSCLDSTWPASPEEHLAAAEEAARRAPRFGEALVNDYLRCALWPEPPDPVGAITAPDAPPLLLVSTTGDPATPHAGAVAVAERLESAVLLTNEGEGHTITFQGDGCVDEVVVAYLLELQLPDGDARC